MSDNTALREFEELALSGQTNTGMVATDERSWVSFLLQLTVDVLHQVRKVRFGDLQREISIKPDGSPVSTIEERIESYCREQVAKFDPTASFVGEEQGGEIDTSGVSLAIDPIDGTWAFVNRAETFATTMVLYRRGRAEVAFIANPATGEIAYAIAGDGARLLQIGLSGDANEAYDLPLVQSSPTGHLLNLHPNRHMGPVMSQLVSCWEASEVGLVKSTGGSPVWSMLDAAKGACTYINLWPGLPAAPYDLAAGILLVRAAGGEVIDLSGKSVSMSGHTGPFVAGIDADNTQRVAKMIGQAEKAGS